MKNLPVRLFVIVLFVASLALGFSSQTQAFSLPCNKVLKMTPQAWSDLLTKETNDTSEQRQDQAAKTWADCKSVSNQALLKSRPKSKARLNKLSALEFQFMKDETDLASGGGMYNLGSGTLYRHGFARFQTDLALHLETMIVLTGSKAGAKQSASINKRYKSAKMIIEARLKKVKTLTPSIPDGSSAGVIADRKKQWTTTVKHYKLTYNSILKLIGTGINEASTLELEFLAKGIFAENF
jgi:hypothetical protein